MRRPRWTLLLLLALVALAWWLQVAWVIWDHGPPESDEWHHLTKAEHYLRGWQRAGFVGLAYQVRILQTAFPPLVHLATLPFFLFHGGFSTDAAVLSLGPWLALLILTTYGTGRTVSGEWGGLTAASMVAAYPLVVSLSHKFLLDLSLAALVSACLWALLMSRGYSRPGWAWLSGVFFALALLAKFIAGVFVVGAYAWLAAPLLLSVLRRAPRWTLPLLALGALLLVGGVLYELRWFSAWLQEGARGEIPWVEFFTSGLPRRLSWLWHLLGLASIALLVLAFRSRSDVTRGVLALAATVTVTIWLAGCWYLPHFDRVVVGVESFSSEGGAGEGDPAPASLAGWLYYPWVMGRVIPRTWFHLLLVGGLLGVSHRAVRRRLGPLLGALFGAYIVMNLSPNKEARYTLSLASVVVVVAIGWTWILPRGARVAVRVVAWVGALVLLTSWVWVRQGWWDAPAAVIWKDDRVFSSGTSTPTQYRFPLEVGCGDVLVTPDFYAVMPLPREMPFDDQELPFGNTGP